jgi:MFS transporter, ACS family, D-galactonate transporter
LIFGREGANARALTEPPPLVHAPYRRLILNRTTLGNWAAGFGAYWALSLLVSWFTPYLVQGLGMSQAQAGRYSVLPWAASIVSTLAMASLSQRLLLRGRSSRVARGLLAGACVTLGGVALAATPFAPPQTRLWLLVLGLSVPSVIYPLSTAIGGEIAPPGQRGALLAIGSAVATSAGLVAPAIMGRVIDGGASLGHGYELGFAISGAIAVAGGLIAMLCVDPEATKAWLARRAEADALARPDALAAAS